MIRLLMLALLLPAVARAEASWDRFQVLMWHDRSPAQLQGLAALGPRLRDAGPLGQAWLDHLASSNSDGHSLGAFAESPPGYLMGYQSNVRPRAVHSRTFIRI